MRRLYHFELSPFSRRVRLVLRHKGLSAELVDPRADPSAMQTMKGLYPLHTAPVFVVLYVGAGIAATVVASRRRPAVRTARLRPLAES